MAQETKEIPFKQYQKLMSEICEKAGEAFSTAIESAGGIEKIERRKVVSLAYGCIQEFGEQCGSLSCMMYESTAATQGKKVRTAEMADLPDYKTVAKNVNGALKTSVKEATKVVEKAVKEVGADTTLKNAARDNAEFAWIPSGAETCERCILIASRGWQRMSANALKNGHAEHIHAGCDCQYAVRFDGTSNVEGYDPNEYLQMYEAAEGDTPEEKFKSLRRANRQNENKKKEDKRVQNNAKMLDKSNKKDIIKGEKSFLDETDFGIETDILNQKSGSLKRAIRKYKKRIDTHADKIAHPEKYVPGWELLEQREKAGTKKHWEKEIRNFNRSIEVRINELKARGDYDE